MESLSRCEATQALSQHMNTVFEALGGNNLKASLHVTVSTAYIYALVHVYAEQHCDACQAGAGAAEPGASLRFIMWLDPIRGGVVGEDLHKPAGWESQLGSCSCLTWQRCA